MEINCPKMRTVFSRKISKMAGKIPNGNKLLRRLRKKSPKMRAVVSRKNFQMAGKYQMEINCYDDFAKKAQK